jgi:hypothetical protein
MPVRDGLTPRPDRLCARQVATEPYPFAPALRPTMEALAKLDPKPKPEPLPRTMPYAPNCFSIGFVYLDGLTPLRGGSGFGRGTTLGFSPPDQ